MARSDSFMVLSYTQMRLSQLLTTGASTDDDLSDLLVQAGYTHRLANGLYTLLPLGHRVLKKICAIVHDEMVRVGAQEVTMPLLQPEELWHKRAPVFGPQLFRLRNESNGRLVLAPTHAEVATILATACIHDSRDLPRVLYQVQPRFRDQFCSIEEGLLQTREFVMADAYGFHADSAGLDESYAAIKGAFFRILSLCGVRAEVVLADSGAMGGHESEEFIAEFPNASDPIAVRCDGCGYAASVEIAAFARPPSDSESPLPVEEVLGEIEASSPKRLRWIPFIAGGRVVLAVTPRAQSPNAVKLLNALSRARMETSGFRAATADELSRMGGTCDWISLVRTPRSVLVVADEAIRTGVNFSIPSTQVGRSLNNVNIERDFRVDIFADLSSAGDGATCLQCGNPMRAIRGVEVGHIFKLGSHYTAFMKMGCYGLGITRIMSTIVEQWKDPRGIIWPERVAPYKVILIPLNETSRNSAEQLYAELNKSDVLFDDSDVSSDEKLRRADLLGIPRQIHLSGDVINIRKRSSCAVKRVTVSEAKLLTSLLAGR
jgi:prolyl-tRNA synthetase